MNPKRVIILGQGRSGTTLAQRVLNTIPNSYIAGENNNFWYHIFKAQKAWEYIPTWEVKIAEKAGQKPFSYNTKIDAYKPCWWNKEYETKSQGVEQIFKTLFKLNYELPSNQTLVGFKEIRFPEEYEEFHAYLDWWKELFPDIYFIFTVRNIDAVTRSGWWKPKDKEKLKNQESLLRSRKDGYLIEYENPDWKGLFNFIGEEYNEKEVKRILDKKL